MPTPPFTDPWLPAPVDGVVPSRRNAIAVAVYKVGATDPLTYTLLPNVVCTSIEEHEGPAPSAASFRYVFDGRDPDGPQAFEEALSSGFTGTHVVEPGDRLAVKALQPDGTPVWIFDGFALDFGGELNHACETAQVHAVGVAKRCWDEPIGGAVYRDGEGDDFATDLVAQFNPRGQGNATPGTVDSGVDPTRYPVFQDVSKTGTDTDGNPYPRDWTLPMAAAYLLYTCNGDEEFVTNPTRDFLDDLLVARKPIDGVPFDPADSGTYTEAEIAAPDTPLTGRNWPNVLHDLVRGHGFGMRFELAGTGTDPQTVVSLWLKQAAAAKPLLLQARGESFDAQYTNVGGAHLSRDLSEVVTSWRVRGALDRWEASFVLAPAFPSQSTDSSSGNIKLYDKTDPAFATDNPDAYRLWILDEDGSGHYANASTTLLTDPASFDAILGAGNWAQRRRPPIGTLFWAPDGKPVQWRAHVSTDYAGTYPAVWDGTGTWRHVGGFQLLKDRIGCRLNVDHPNRWNVGKSDDSSAPFRGGVIKAVESIGNPTTANPAFFVRITVVFEGDKGLVYTAGRTGSAPVQQEIVREVDAGDRYRREYRYSPSEFKTDAGNATLLDQTAFAQAEAVALRAESDGGAFDGHVEVPRFTAYYDVGDRISSIDGRGLSLRTNAGDSDYAPVYPVVVSRRWEFEGGQKTVLKLSDAGIARRQFAAKHRRGRR